MKKNDAMLGLYLMTTKGIAVLKRLLEHYGSDRIAFIVTAQDDATHFDGHEEILRLARNAGIPAYFRSEIPQQHATFLLAVSWRWLIHIEPSQQLVVFHDSLLPRYRGFAPLVNALINGEEHLGVTALFASEDYDRGPIIAQESVRICYPISISEAISKILPCYENLVIEIAAKLFHGNVESHPQDESLATYSLWLDDDDYHVNWSWDARRIQRFVDAVGFPYRGATVTIDGKLHRLRECAAQPDVRIENRTAGKVIFLDNGKPVVVCGEGLLKILKITLDGSDANLLPLPRFRIRFSDKR